MIKLLIKVENLKSGEHQFWTHQKGGQGVQKISPNFVSCLGPSSTLQSIKTLSRSLGGIYMIKLLIQVENLKSGERQLWTPQKEGQGVEKISPNFVNYLCPKRPKKTKKSLYTLRLNRGFYPDIIYHTNSYYFKALIYKPELLYHCKHQNDILAVRKSSFGNPVMFTHRPLGVELTLLITMM